MGDIFYLIGTFIALLNFRCITRHRQIFDVTDWLFKFKQVTGRYPTNIEFRDKDSHSVLFAWSVTVVMTAVWMIIGLLTRNWIIFLLLLLINISVNRLSNNMTYNSLKRILFLSKSIMISSSISLLIINHFHLKLDLSKYILSMFGYH